MLEHTQNVVINHFRSFPHLEGHVTGSHDMSTYIATILVTISRCNQSDQSLEEQG